MEKLVNAEPVSEGMYYGPIAPPDLHPENGAQWVMDAVNDDLVLYQLNMLKEHLLTDSQEGRVDRLVAHSNMSRLNNEIARATAKPHIQHYKETPRMHKWVQAADFEQQALLEMAGLTKNREEAARTREAAYGVRQDYQYRKAVQELNRT